MVWTTFHSVLRITVKRASNSEISMPRRAMKWVEPAEKGSGSASRRTRRTPSDGPKNSSRHSGVGEAARHRRCTTRASEEDAMTTVLTALAIETGAAVAIAASLAAWARRGFPTRARAAAAVAE